MSAYFFKLKSCFEGIVGSNKDITGRIITRISLPKDKPKIKQAACVL